MESMISKLEGQPQKIRKGARSCTECRQRKIKCAFTSSGDRICQHCTAHGRACTPQVYRHDSTSRLQLSDRQRLNVLEQCLAQIAANVVDTNARTPPAVNSASAHGQVEETASLVEPREEDEATSSNALTHLRLLFDNVATPEELPQEGTHAVGRINLRLRSARAALQSIVPCRKDVAQIATSATSWMQTFNTLFPTLTILKSSTELISRYVEFMNADAHPVLLSAFLLTLAITVTELSFAGTKLALESPANLATLARRIAEAVKLNVIANDEMAATMDGIEVLVLYTRLQLARGEFRDMWLTTRRMVALAEFMSLHRIPYLESRPDPTRERRVALLEAVYATDRIAAMMFSLPAGTSSYKLPVKRIVLDSGQVSTYAYMLELASISMGIQALDEDVARGVPYEETYNKVLASDNELRMLASRTSFSWWQESSNTFQPHYIVQYLHSYLTVRVHLHSAMRRDIYDQYAYSRSTCISACQKTARRYFILRQLLPKGFFMTRVLQMQIFTVAIVLLLSHDRESSSSGLHTPLAIDRQRLAMVEQVVESLGRDITQFRTDFAVEAVAALRSLLRWLENPATHAAEDLVLRVPMLGKVRIGKSNNETEDSLAGGRVAPRQESTYLSQGMAYAPQGVTSFAAPEDLSIGQDSMPWLLELDMDAMYDDIFLAGALESQNFAMSA